MSVNLADNVECWSLMVLDCNSFPTSRYCCNATNSPILNVYCRFSKTNNINSSSAVFVLYLYFMQTLMIISFLF